MSSTKAWFAKRHHSVFTMGSTYWSNTRAASFPGTKRCSGNPSIFAGIPMIFLVVLRNQSKMELLYQAQKFVEDHMSGNAQPGK